MTTIYDVANYAGVSKSTVSLVLNNSELVKPETKNKVLEAIETLNYVPNQNARGLSSKKTNCIGIIIMRSYEQTSDTYEMDQSTGLYSYNIATGIMDEMLNTKYGVFVERFCSIAYPDELPMLIKNKRVDGAVIVGSPYSPKMISTMQEMQFPFVLVGVDSVAENIDCVTADPADGVRIGLDYLYKNGHRNICLLNCPSVFRSSKLRKDAFISELKKYNLQVNPDMIIECQANDGESAYRAMKQILDSGVRPDAVLTANDHIAIGAMRYAVESGLKVPDDISIFGYVDSSFSCYCIPGLSTVNIHKEHMGSEAAKLLIERMQNPEKKACVVKVQGDIVIRDSVKNIN